MKTGKIHGNGESRRTILAVDDDPAVRELLRTILTEAGYSVILAEGGRSAIQVYRSAGVLIHLLLTDVVMPDLTGPVLAQRLRAENPYLNVLFISGFHDSELVQRFASMKGFSLIAKPFTPEGLLRAVNACLGQRR